MRFKGGHGVGLQLAPGNAANSFSWSQYWTNMISATVEDAQPTHIVMTWANGKNIVASDLTCTVNGSSVAVSSASWTGGVLTAVLASAVIYGDVVVMTFVKTGQTKSVTNNIAAEAEFTSYLSTLSGTITTTWKRETNKLIKSFKNAALWENGALWGRTDHINNFIGHISQANALKNMYGDANHATQSGTNSFNNKGIRVNYPAASAYVNLGFNPSSEATHHTNTSGTIVVFTLRKDYTGKYHVGAFDGTKFSGVAACPTGYPAGNAYGGIACTLKDLGANPAQKRGVYFMRRTGTTASLRVNKVAVGSPVTVTNQGFANMDYWLGGFHYTGDTLNQQGGNRYPFVMFTDYMTDNECDTLDDLLHTYLNNANTSGALDQKTCVCDGNSLTLGTGASDAAHSYPSLMALEASGWEVANLGISGQETPVMTTNAP